MSSNLFNLYTRNTNYVTNNNLPSFMNSNANAPFNINNPQNAGQFQSNFVNQNNQQQQFKNFLISSKKKNHQNQNENHQNYLLDSSNVQNVNPFAPPQSQLNSKSKSHFSHQINQQNPRQGNRQPNQRQPRNLMDILDDPNFFSGDNNEKKKENDGMIIDGLFKVIFTPGHTNCSVIYIINDIMFSGDTLFFGSVGRTDLYTGSSSTLLKTLKMIKGFKINYKICIFILNK